MVSIFDLLKEEKEKMEKMNKLRTELVEKERLRKLDEANAWANIDFKSIGATTDKLRAAAVSRHMNQYPNVYGQKKAEFDNLAQEIKFIRETIGIMKEFGVENIEFSEEKEEDKDKGDGSQTTD